MSLVNSFGKWFNRKPAAASAVEGGDALDAAMSLDNSPLRESYQADAMHSVQGDPSSLYGDALAPEENQVALPLLGSAPAATQQRRLFALAGIGAVVLALVAGWVLQQAERSAQQLAATGQALMQSQRLAKSVSQALVGSPQAFPEVAESAGVLSRNVRALSGGDTELGVPLLGESFTSDLESINPLVERADRNEIGRAHV